MKHKHYDMICAKAGDMDLVVFHKSSSWYEYGRVGAYCPFYDDEEYFLCLPQHKDAVLNLLNGGESQVKRDKWLECNLGGSNRWSNGWWYMDEKCESRIKPRKEKRWIGVDKSGCCTNAYETRGDVICYLGIDYKEDWWQLIEIEVEV